MPEVTVAAPRDVLMANGLRNIAAELAGQVLHDPTHVKALRAYADDLDCADPLEREA